MIGAQSEIGSIEIWKIFTNCVSIYYTVNNIDLPSSCFSSFLVAEFVFFAKSAAAVAPSGNETWCL